MISKLDPDWVSFAEPGMLAHGTMPTKIGVAMDWAQKGWKHKFIVWQIKAWT